jgi:hypothetical protein
MNESNQSSSINRIKSQQRFFVTQNNGLHYVYSIRHLASVHTLVLLQVSLIVQALNCSSCILHCSYTQSVAVSILYRDLLLLSFLLLLNKFFLEVQVRLDNNIHPFRIHPSHPSLCQKHQTTKEIRQKESSSNRGNNVFLYLDAGKRVDQLLLPTFSDTVVVGSKSLLVLASIA